MTNYPGAIDTDATLYVARDQIQTKLNAPQSAADTVAVVASTTGWAASMIATIENEQQFVVSVVGANTLNVTRAFGGTAAAAHPAGKTVSNFVDAAYHETVKSAVIAIETALGANLAHVLSGVPPTTLGPSTGEGIPGADNPYTAPNVFCVRDGTTAAPQGTSASPSVVFQRANSLVNNIANAFVFDAYNTKNASANPAGGVTTMTNVVHDVEIARGGVAHRSVAYIDKPPAIAALVSATISGSDIIVITSTPHMATLNNGMKFTGTSGITGIEVFPLNVTQIDSPTQFRIAKGGFTGGPATGGTVTASTSYYGSWESCFKMSGPQLRVVGCENDMNNHFADAGEDLLQVDATLNYALYISGFNGTCGLLIDSGDTVAKYYHPLKFGRNAVVANYPYIDTSDNNNAYVADFAWIGNNQFLKWLDTTAGKWPLLGLDPNNDLRISAPIGHAIAIGPNLALILNVFADHITASKPVIFGPTTVAALPAASTMKGAVITVTDSNVNTWGTVVAGGGALTVLAFSNGTTWTVAGK